MAIKTVKPLARKLRVQDQINQEVKRGLTTEHDHYTLNRMRAIVGNYEKRITSPAPQKVIVRLRKPLRTQ